MVFVTRTPPRRYLRVYFTPRIQRQEQIAILGHELWHVVEVANHPEVIDQDTLRMLYVSTGHGHDDYFDTDAAIRAGHIIAHELITAAAIDNSVKARQ
jgi:hypothetical protein